MYFGAAQEPVIKVNGLFFSVFQSATAMYDGIKGHQKSSTAGRPETRMAKTVFMETEYHH